MNPTLTSDPASTIIYLLIAIWSIAWKGVALWRAANLKQKNWFVAMLVINIIGILEIVYLFWFAEKKLTIKEMKSWIGR